MTGTPILLFLGTIRRIKLGQFVYCRKIDKRVDRVLVFGRTNILMVFFFNRQPIKLLYTMPDVNELRVEIMLKSQMYLF